MSPRKIAPPMANCPFSSKIIAPTQVNSHQRVVGVNWWKLLQLRSKKWFTSKYFLQILTKACRTPFIREHLSPSASWFCYARTQKKAFWGKKLIRKKIQKNFMVNNNNKIIPAWCLREAPGEHTYLPKKSGIFPVKIVRN